MNFWSTLPKPIVALAPMADVTDSVFRALIARHGKPDVTWTEFVSADGLALAPEEGRKKLLKDLEFSEAERPIIAQFFTAHPEHMEAACRLAYELGFDGVDINMGCPDASIEKQGAGAAMIRTPDQAVAVLRAAKRGAGNIPVSVKTRVGFNQEELDTWIPRILAEKPAALTVHARTRKELSLVPARWELIRKVVALRDTLSPETLILGNGDVSSLRDGIAKARASGADGVMIGRAFFGNPWLCRDLQKVKEEVLPLEGVLTPRKFELYSSIDPSITVEERLRALLEHSALFLEKLGGVKSFATMKKHYKGYVHGWPGSAELRARLMECNTLDELTREIDAYLELQRKA
jgi:nifR3 family TIM-barrel protein